MKAKRVVLATIFLFALTLGSCTTDSIAEEESLYPNEQAVDLSKVHRPGSGGN